MMIAENYNDRNINYDNMCIIEKLKQELLAKELENNIIRSKLGSLERHHIKLVSK